MWRVLLLGWRVVFGGPVEEFVLTQHVKTEIVSSVSFLKTVRNRPLQVYLDSSDYSRFADVYRGRGNASDEIAFTRLLELKEQGRVQFLYSSVHICEAIAREAAAIEAATARLHVMSLLSGKNVLRAWTELSSLDVFSVSIDGESPAIKPVDRDRFHGRSVIGEWFPGLPLLFAEIGEELHLMHSDPLKLDLVKETLSDLNRKQRRAANARLKSTSYKSGLQNQIRANWPSTFLGICNKLPVLESQSAAWYRFVSSPNPDPVPVYRAFVDGFSDPKILARFLAPDSDSVSEKLTSWMRNGSKSLIATVDQVANLRTVLQDVRLSGARTGVAKRFREAATEFEANWFHREHQWIQQEMGEAFRSLVYAGGVSTQVPWSPTLGETRLLPSVVNRASVFRAYFEQAFSPFGAHRAREKFTSDVGDIMHAQYLPYCDVFRCDAFAYTYLNKPAKRVGTHLIPSHHELHLAIESQLNKHNATKEGRADE